MATEDQSLGIVETILTLAQKLEKKVVAEGVETEDQAAALVELGCGYGQGFLFSRPLWSTEAEKLITKDGALNAVNDEPVPGVEVTSEIYAM